VISKLRKKTACKRKRKKSKKRSAQKGQQRPRHIQPLDEKSHPIQWTEFPTGVVVGAGSCWPRKSTNLLLPGT
jgi:ribosomal protein S25